MAGIMDFLFGRGPLTQAAQGGASPQPQPGYAPANINMAQLAQQQAQAPGYPSLPASPVGSGGVTMVDPRMIGPNMGAPSVGGEGYPGAPHPSMLAQLSSPDMQRVFMNAYQRGQQQQPQAPPMQMAPSAGIGQAKVPMQGLFNFMGR